jgi:hypothetical protein
MKDKKEIQSINKLCLRCAKKCKQSGDVTLFICPNYEYKPQQLELKFRYRRKKEK